MIARDPLLGLFAFYAPRGWTLEALSRTSPAERAFLEGARALYYEEQISMGEAGTALGVARHLAGR